MGGQVSGSGSTPQGGIAQAFVLARREARGLVAYPGVRPRTLAAAYLVQDEAIRLDGRELAGWKVGRIPEGEAAQLGCNRLAGPIFAATVAQATPGVATPMPAYADGFIAIEAEFMLRLRVPRGAVRPLDDAQTLDWIEDMRMGIEVASSPYPGINDDGPCVTVSDFGNNAGVLLGAAIPDWRARDLLAIEVTTHVAGHEVGRATAASMLDGPLGAMRFLLGHLEQRGIAPQDGWWISSGAVTGVHVARIGENAQVRFAGLGTLACQLVAAGL